MRRKKSRAVKFKITFIVFLISMLYFVLNFYLHMIKSSNSKKCTISEKVVFVKWNITTNDEANQNNFINEWRGEAESWVYEICFDLPSHELWYFISQKPLFQKFHFNFLYKELDSWNVFISCTSPWYIISQNHISKSFLKIFAKNLC